MFFTSREEGASPVSGRGREPVSGKLGGFSWAFTQERRTGEGCGPFREKQACRFSVNILFVCLTRLFVNLKVIFIFVGDWCVKEIDY